MSSQREQDLALICASALILEEMPSIWRGDLISRKGLIVRFDDVGKDGVDTSVGRVPWLDGESCFAEAQFRTEDLVQHPIVIIVGGGVVRDASESVEYVLRQHVGLVESDCLSVSTKHVE